MLALVRRILRRISDNDQHGPNTQQNAASLSLATIASPHMSSMSSVKKSRGFMVPLVDRAIAQASSLSILDI